MAFGHGVIHRLARAGELTRRAASAAPPTPTKPTMMYPKNLFIIAVCALSLLNFSGCATVPSGPYMPTYSISGIAYFPLISLCQAKGVAWEYDTLTRSAILTKGGHKVNLMVGDKTILVDGEPRHLNYPVDIYQGTVAVPSKLADILDNLIVKDYYLKPQLVPGRIKKIVIDAGHGGSDPGAIGKTGIREKVINLDIAKRLASILKESGIQVMLTRSTDSAVSLERRVEIANSAKADLFISIHSNANRVSSLNGFEIYYLAPRSDDYKRLLLTANSARLDFDPACFSSRSTNLKAILWDMIYTSNRSESIRLSRAICRTIDRNLETKVIGIKHAGFYVLKGVRIPAVLIELGFLSNSDEERLLKNSYYRQQIAEAIAQGISDYSGYYAATEGLN